MPDGNIFNAACPSRQVMEILAEKWALLIIDALGEGPKRTAVLRRHIGGISEKMLIQTLRKLERNGFVCRKVHVAVPPHVEYALSELGHSLERKVAAFDRWVEEHLGEVMRARQAFDRERDYQKS
jgi:DNA-binding HxlR family transcriptional regulator